MLFAPDPIEHTESLPNQPKTILPVLKLVPGMKLWDTLEAAPLQVRTVHIPDKPTRLAVSLSAPNIRTVEANSSQFSIWMVDVLDRINTGRFEITARPAESSSVPCPPPGAYVFGNTGGDKGIIRRTVMAYWNVPSQDGEGTCWLRLQGANGSTREIAMDELIKMVNSQAWAVYWSAEQILALM